jgi:hypothetical protein
MAINPVRVDYLTVCGFIHSQNKFLCLQFSEIIGSRKFIFGGANE